MVRILNILLLLITFVGVYFVAQVSTKFEATRDEYARLTAKVGRLPIEDATKVYVTAINTDDPLDFAWHVYVPAKFNGKWESKVFLGGTTTTFSMNGEPRMEIIRVRFRKIDGQWHLWRKFIGSSGSGGVRCDELLDRPELLFVRQLGKGQVIMLEPDEVSTLLEITTSEPQRAADDDEVLCIIRFGSQDAWVNQQSKGNRTHD